MDYVVWFYTLKAYGVGVSLMLLPAFGTLPPNGWPCLASTCGYSLGSIVSCFDLFSHCLLEASSFFKEK